MKLRPILLLLVILSLSSREVAENQTTPVDEHTTCPQQIPVPAEEKDATFLISGASYVIVMENSMPGKRRLSNLYTPKSLL